MIFVTTAGNEETKCGYCLRIVGSEREERHGEHDESEELHDTLDDRVYSNYMVSIFISVTIKN
jgi:hypothetical protein